MKKLSTSLLLLFTLSALVLPQALLGGSAKVGGQGVVRRAAAGGGSSTLNTGLAGYWKLDEASGTRADSTAGGNDLTDNNTVASTTGKISNAALFVEPNSEHLSHATNATLEAGDIDHTVAGWVYLNTKATSQVIVAKFGLSAGQAEYALLYSTSADRFRFQVHISPDDGRSVDATTFGSPSTATWYFVVGWHNAATNTVNISVNDGTVDSAGTTGSLQAAGNADFAIGRFGSWGNYYMDGRNDEVGFWKKVLSGSEITELYNSGNGKTCCPF